MKKSDLAKKYKMEEAVKRAQREADEREYINRSHENQIGLDDQSDDNEEQLYKTTYKMRVSDNRKLPSYVFTAHFSPPDGGIDLLSLKLNQRQLTEHQRLNTPNTSDTSDLRQIETNCFEQWSGF